MELKTRVGSKKQPGQKQRVPHCIAAQSALVHHTEGYTYEPETPLRVSPSGRTLSMSDWISHFSELGTLPTSALEQLTAGSSSVVLKEDDRLFGPGMAPKHFMLVIEGCVRVQQVSQQGREIVLYRIQPGESCTLTTACLLGGEVYQAEGVVEQNSRAIVVPRELFDELIVGSLEFRRFVFSAFNTRITDLMRTVEVVAFQRIDTRLSQRLLELANDANEVHLTHQQLSIELGSAREVVSRQLKEFERKGLIEQTRGVVNLIDVEAIRRLSLPR